MQREHGMASLTKKALGSGGIIGVTTGAVLLLETGQAMHSRVTGSHAVLLVLRSATWPQAFLAIAAGVLVCAGAWKLRRHLQRRKALAMSRAVSCPGSTVAKRENNERLARSYAAGTVELDSLPNFLIVDTTSKCNLKCLMCWQTTVSEEESPRVHLSHKALAEALAVKDTLTRVNFHGSGEPLLNARFAEIVGEFRGQVDYMETCTNGTAVTRKNAAKLLDAGLNVIRFSCDGDNAESFERLRCGANFDKFIDNVKLTVALKQELASPSHIGFNFVVSRESWRELPGVVRLAESLGLDFIAIFAYIKMGDGVDDLVMPKEGVEAVRKFISDYRTDPSSKCYLMLAPSLDASHEVMEQIPETSTTTKGEPGSSDNRMRCGALYSMMNIKADGSVYPCCIHPSKMGDLNRNTVEEIWNGEAYRDLRRQHATGEVDEMCLRCFDGLRYVTTR
jgi:MoaA/NifB/PqqE/SkfB family radical SAM enzyme